MKVQQLFEATNKATKEDVSTYTTFWNAGPGASSISDIPASVTRQQLQQLWDTTFPVGSHHRQQLDKAGITVDHLWICVDEACKMWDSGTLNWMPDFYSITWNQYVQNLLKDMSKLNDFMEPT